NFAVVAFAGLILFLETVRHLAAALGKRIMSTARPDTEPPPSEPPMSPMTEPAAAREHVSRITYFDVLASTPIDGQRA
ncbi:MAG TPA: hypothetical protein VIY30_04285, partial [Burkholderiaceae bacterium]